MTDTTQIVTQEDLLSFAFSAFMFDIETSEPGKIVDYDAEKQRATIQPLAKIRPVSIPTGETEREAQEFSKQSTIPNVPVVWPSVNTGSVQAIISLPIGAESKGRIVYTKYPIRNYLSESGYYIPESDELFRSNGPFFVPGGMPDGDAITGLDSGKLQIKVKSGDGADSEISIDASSGKIGIRSSDAVEIDSDGDFTTDSKNVVLKCETGKLGSGATEPVMLGNKTKEILDDMLQDLAATPSCTGSAIAAVAINPVFTTKMNLIIAKVAAGILSNEWKVK